MYLTIIILPLLGSIASGLFGRKRTLSKKDNKKYLHTKVSKEPIGSEDSKESKEPKDSEDSEGSKEPLGSKDSKESKESKDSKGHYFSGLVDGEGWFRVRITRRSKYIIGWHVQAVFVVQAHIRDLLLLQQLNNFLGGFGKIYQNTGSKKSMASLEIYSIAGLLRVLSHFSLYPLLTQKRADFELFKLVVEMIQRKEHLTLAGLRRIVSIRASMNWGLSDALKKAFSDIVPFPRPSVNFNGKFNPFWLAGFVDGEGCFFVSLLKSTHCKLGVSISLEFSISQHSRDMVVMNSLVAFFGCGRVKLDSRCSNVSYFVGKFSDIISKIVPFFIQYPLQSVKGLDFVDFCKVVEIMEAKGHLTLEGIEQVRAIKEGMNRGRVLQDNTQELRLSRDNTANETCT